MGRLPWFPKYVLGPALAAALGYWIVGPRLAGSKRFQSLVKEHASQMAARAEPTGENSVAAGPEPEVTVGVKPVGEGSPEARPKRRRRRHPTE